jgi:aryl-alcohol dehydrogenase-like predicted oxidoreductase
LERRELGTTGIHLPVIGVGARSAFDVFGKEGQAARRVLVDTALEQGANFFETSPEAGEADGILAAALTGRRNRAIVSASIDPTDFRLAHARIDRLLRLFEERLDILMVEGPDAWPEFARPFRFMKSDRSVRAIGVSCPDPSQFDSLARLMERGELDVIQVPYSPASTGAAEKILPLAAELQLGVIAVQPFEGGWMLDIQHVDPLIEPLRRYGVHDLPQTILKWVVSDRRVTSVVVGSRRANVRAGRRPWFSGVDREIVGEFFHSQVVGDSYR